MDAKERLERATKNLMSTAEVAAYLGITRQGVGHHKRSGKLDSAKVGEADMFDRKQVMGLKGESLPDEYQDKSSYNLGRAFAIADVAGTGAFSAADMDTAMRHQSSALALIMRKFTHKVLEDEMMHAVDGIESLPDNATYEQQGQFQLGYYHQRTRLLEDKELGS